MGNKSSNDSGAGCAKFDETGSNETIPTEQLVDIPVGGTFTHPNYCYYGGNLGGSANCGNTGEFISNGNTVDTCRCLSACTDICRRFSCKRIAYKADPLQCCSTQKSYLSEGYTCDPKYRTFDKPDCNDYMKSYCATDDNFFTNPNCVLWAKKQGDVADKIILDVCRKPENVGKKECSCVTATDEINAKYGKGNKVPAHCIDNRCTNNNDALKTSGMKEVCNLINCEIDLSDLKTADIKVVQQCGNKSIETDTKVPTQKTTISSSTISITLIIFFILISIIIAVMTAVL